MSAPLEVIVSTDGSGQLWNACVWDLQTGTSLTVYKGGGNSAHRTLSIINDEYLISASTSKPLIHLWTLQRRDEHMMRMVLPGRVTALDVTPDGNYCIAAISERIHVWQLCTGNLIAVLSRHYQSINCLKVTDDGNYFVSGGEDNLVIVWCLARICSQLLNQTSKLEPEYVLSSHSLPVTDIHVGNGGIRARVLSSSLDQTCKLWDLCSGRLLCSFIFDVSLMSVAMDAAELRLFAGGLDGTVFAVNLYAEPIRSERHISSSEGEEVIKFSGHSKQVTCLQVSFDGTKLVSGSHDCTARVWDVNSGQCVKMFNHKGPVTNVLVKLTPPSLIHLDYKPNMPIKQFKRHLHVSGQAGSGDDSQSTDVLDVLIKSHDMPVSDLTVNTVKKILEEEGYGSELKQECKEHEILELKAEISKLKSVNKHMYQFAVNEILHGSNKVTFR